MPRGTVTLPTAHQAHSPLTNASQNLAALTSP